MRIISFVTLFSVLTYLSLLLMPHSINERVIIEAGSEVPAADAFFASFGKNPNRLHFITDISAIDTAKVGAVSVELGFWGGKHESLLVIEDTVPPVGSPVSRSILAGNSVPPQDFVTGLTDVTRVTCQFAETPDFLSVGQRDVRIILTDEGGNKTEIVSRLYVTEEPKPVIPVKKEADKTPPIADIVDRWVYAGQAVGAALFVDNIQDSSSVSVTYRQEPNFSRQGNQTVYLLLEDEYGNRTEYSALMIVVKDGGIPQGVAGASDMDLINETADEILSEIIQEGMTIDEKAFAIFTWVNKKVRYNAGNNPRTLAQGAYACFFEGTGDCYVYRAGSKVLLTRAGIKNLDIERHGGISEHYWNLVNTGGGWYHFDACPTKGISPAQKFMFTASEARAMTEFVGGGKKYYVYDESRYPGIVDN